MKQCPQCDTGYPDSHITCPTHGVQLNEIRDLKSGMVVHQSYRIVRKLGQGGMGAVYLAHHTLMNEPQALKFLSNELSQDQAFTSRFLREVRTLRQIRHKNVVDAGNLEPAEDGTLFFSMEFVDGPDLRRFFHDVPQPFDVPLALSITRGIAEGLGAAHAKGMVHRDIKPENILMAREGDNWLPKIADFGIVATKESSTVYTCTGGTMLTMSYAAPEQWRGTPAAELDGRTDLYALGGLLYEMLTGQTPFNAESYEGWAHQHQTTPPPPPSALRADLANWQGLDTLVQHLLAKDREDRPKDVAELLNLLDAVQLVAPDAHLETEIDENAAHLIQEAVEKRPKNRRRGILFGLLAGGFILAVLVAFFSLHRSPQPKNITMQVPVAVQSQTGKSQPEQPQQVSQADQVLGSLFGHKTPNAQITTPKPTNQQSGSFQGLKPAQVEVLKPGVQQLSIAYLDKQAGSLYDQKRFADAAPLYDQACTGGLGSDCKRLGSMYEHGDGVRKDYSQAATLYSKSCIAGDKSGCDALIPMYMNGIISEQDASRAEILFSDACNSGNAHGCASLGFMYERGAGVARNSSRAVTLYSKACDIGESRGCLNLSVMYANGSGVTKDDSQAAKLSAKACDGGEALGCANLAFGYENGRGVQRDYSRAAIFYSKACDGGIAVGCGNLGLLYDNGKGVVKDIPRAISLYTKACDAGYFAGCHNLAILYENGDGVAKDPSRAVALLLKACNGGSSESCFNLGHMYDSGNGVSRDYERAAMFYSKACDAGEAMSCSNLGFLYGNGSGVTKDYSRAATLFSKSCDAGYAMGCSNLGFLYETGNGVAKDYSKSVELFKKSCDASDARGCAYLGYMYANGNGVSKDITKAKQFLKMSCSMGFQWGCDRLKEIP
ncbi:MAG: protein kinase [Terracidiphilus sp.]